jgi:hypothetical protein
VGNVALMLDQYGMNTVIRLVSEDVDPTVRIIQDCVQVDLKLRDLKVALKTLESLQQKEVADEA